MEPEYNLALCRLVSSGLTVKQAKKKLASSKLAPGTAPKAPENKVPPAPVPPAPKKVDKEDSEVNDKPWETK